MNRMFLKPLRKALSDEKSGGVVLIICTIVSLIIANSAFKEQYLHFWHIPFAGLSLELWINDGLMAIFFLMIGLELKREVAVGEFSRPRNAILPVAAALGGMIVPVAFFLLFNLGLPTQSGVGIPMATDIAFALGVLSLLGKRVPTSLKVFLMALAVVDDLGAIMVIAIFYTKDLMLLDLSVALGIFAFLAVLNRFKVHSLIPYFIGGAAMWYFMLQSGVHATIAGVLLALVIPSADRKDGRSPSFMVMHKLHLPVTFIILPVFALANTAVTISSDWHTLFAEPISLGILSGLLLGKPIGITLASLIVIVAKLSKLPTGVNWYNMIGAGLLGGIGFTMSIFITLLAFDDQEIINTSKIVILTSSLLAGVLGYICLHMTLKKS
ncbi:NhaA family Na+:H+ antiporter [Dysgonomonas alginatilytica]|uniref:Na(+)/H(+) antiporter NhaA n=1 Tax=Dysgonomonas alginatilytica TaxID=1605892 RepID=A0A2V3PUI2_9BACT|nr:Na+/H+ antiporter NhaA [Dysgonomonas alginatilytica]PXV67550.1 NhaA family Na+:H+ antiporter [Dysgonomonas alginatilytica]